MNARHECRAFSLTGATTSASSLDAENHRQGEIQAFVGDRRWRLRYRIGSPDHGKRRLAAGGIARSLHDARRKDVA